MVVSPVRLCFHLTEHHQILKEKANSLKLRPDNFQEVLEGIGFILDQSTGPVGEGGPSPKIFRQPIQVIDYFINRIPTIYKSLPKIPDLIHSIHQ